MGELPPVNRIELVDCDLSEPRNSHYVELALERSPGARLLGGRSTPASTLAFLARFMRDVLMRKRLSVLVVGNPRRWQALLYSRLAERVIVLEEGIGTTRTGEYFDPRVNEKSSAKRALIVLGLLPPYSEMLAKVAAHYTAFPSSVLPNRRPLPYVSLATVPPEATRQRERIAIIVSSLFREGDHTRYQLACQAALSSGVAYDSTFFSFHPKDDTKAVSAFCLKNGVEMLVSHQVLEDYILERLSGGVHVDVFGDWNSSVEIVQNSLRPDWKWGNFCQRVKAVW